MSVFMCSTTDHGGWELDAATGDTRRPDGIADHTARRNTMTTPTPQPLDLDAIEDRAGEYNVLEDIHALVAEVRRLRETARRAEHMENVMTRIPADVLEQAVRETRQPS